MSHTYDPTNDIGMVRLLIGDTDISPTTDAQFSDEEIQAFLTLTASGSTQIPKYAAAEALRSMASDAGNGLMIKTATFAKDTKGRADKLRGLADDYRRQYQEQPAEYTAEIAQTDDEAARIAINRTLREQS